jgi:hypothetical protein
MGNPVCVTHNGEVEVTTASESSEEPSPALVATALALAQDRVEDIFTAVYGPPNAGGTRLPQLVYDRALLRELIVDILELRDAE